MKWLLEMTSAKDLIPSCFFGIKPPQEVLNHFSRRSLKPKRNQVLTETQTVENTGFRWVDKFLTWACVCACSLFKKYVERVVFVVWRACLHEHTPLSVADTEISYLPEFVLITPNILRQRYITRMSERIMHFFLFLFFFFYTPLHFFFMDLKNVCLEAWRPFCLYRRKHAA